MISFVVPAHNEQELIGATLRSLHASAPAASEPYEVVVVDDASTDDTAPIARALGARVVAGGRRHIAATRNAGARAAHGDLLIFIDADTLATPAAVRAAVRATRGGAVGGGCLFGFDGRLPLYARLLHPALMALARRLKIVGGCFLFCTRDAFRAVGGFSERQFAAEELYFARALQRRGRFVIPAARVVTSGRKLRTMSARDVLNLIGLFALGGAQAFRRREGLEVWYGSRRPDPDDVQTHRR